MFKNFLKKFFLLLAKKTKILKFFFTRLLGRHKFGLEFDQNTKLTQSLWGGGQRSVVFLFKGMVPRNFLFQSIAPKMLLVDCNTTKNLLKSWI